jgi:hypothetical protein
VNLGHSPRELLKVLQHVQGVGAAERAVAKGEVGRVQSRHQGDARQGHRVQPNRAGDRAATAPQVHNWSSSCLAAKVVDRRRHFLA